MKESKNTFKLKAIKKMNEKNLKEKDTNEKKDDELEAKGM